ncbi:hypothetical protein Taro_009505 [Colocasia esculenta]|uniref:Late embryogenesis abundant protein LEA-2 subgroup domain-containing protein n=1 Tax=Colocasia esculenta TaxID=4460 RepID=A0A843U0C2_COLES|nr:hypothetical protein [Colocasia esculenta]
MAEQQKIHPMDVEAAGSPTAPLAPRELLGSEKGDPAQHPPQPPSRTIPVSHSRPPKRRGGRCCCRCLCWTGCLLLLLIILIAVSAGVLYLVFQPKAPKYSVDRLRISALTVDPANLNVSATFDVTVTATNPNKKIGIYYEDGSHLSVWYSGTSLCSGSFPAFYQGHRNTTVVNVELSGQTQVGSDLLTALQAAATQQTGSVPLQFKGDVPVRVKFGLLKLRKVRFLVNCDLVVNSLNVNSQISIRTSRCRFKLRR